MQPQVTCCDCGLEFPRGRARYVKRCPDCRVTKQAAWVAIQNERKRAVCRTIRGEATAGGCSRCGETDQRVMQFHHVDPSTKLFTIANGAQSAARLRAEIAKCVVLCANCHIIVESEERDAPPLRTSPDTRHGGPVDSGTPRSRGPAQPTRSHLA